MESHRRAIAHAVAGLLPALLLAAASAAHAEGGPFAPPGGQRLAQRFAATAQGLELRVVELPSAQPPGFGPPRRAHHALSFRNEAPRRWLQELGVDAVDCTTRVRFPSRLGPSADGRRLAAEVAAQVHFSCRF